MKDFCLVIFIMTFSLCLFGQTPQSHNPIMYEIVEAVSSDRLESDIRKLADFGTRHTLSDTMSKTRGIGAARRWIKAEFDMISKECNGCLNVSYQRNLIKKEANRRIPFDVEVVNVVAIQKGKTRPNDYIIMSGDIDSRISDPNNYTDDSPGANDNASGMAGTIEAARVLSKYSFASSILYVGLSGEEQGLFGGKGLAAYADSMDWNIIGIINNDMIGNIEGIDGIIDNRSFRIFSEPITQKEPPTEREQVYRRVTGGEVDGISRQLARYVHRQTQQYMPEMKPMMIYRLDRFGRGGHHRPFNDMGYAGIRIMETHEHYDRQHQDLRMEDGIAYGDVIEGVDFEFTAKLTAVNAISLAGIASAPPAPVEVGIGGAVRPSTRLSWREDTDETIAGYIVYWRDTTSPVWQYSKFVGKVNSYTLKNVVVDNFYFGVASVNKNGDESIVTFPSYMLR